MLPERLVTRVLCVGRVLLLRPQVKIGRSKLSRLFFCASLAADTLFFGLVLVKKVFFPPKFD